MFRILFVVWYDNKLTEQISNKNKLIRFVEYHRSVIYCVLCVIPYGRVFSLSFSFYVYIQCMHRFNVILI